MNIVLDTNVLVSGLLNPSGKAAAVLNHMLSGSITLCFDSRIIDEYERVLLRPAFGFREEDVKNLIGFIDYLGVTIVPKPFVHGISDPDDRAFIEVAKSANCPVVTGNKKHFPEEHVKVYSPSEILDLLEKADM